MAAKKLIIKKDITINSLSIQSYTSLSSEAIKAINLSIVVCDKSENIIKELKEKRLKEVEIYHEYLIIKIINPIITVELITNFCDIDKDLEASVIIASESYILIEHADKKE